MELSTTYMGLALRNPLVASASPLSYTVDGVRRLANAGVGAVVLFSLFEEQLREEAARNAGLVDGPAESFPEALDYVPQVVKQDAGPRGYLSLLERSAAAVEVPVIASLNGVTPEGWTDYARAMQNAGAAAIELNVYRARRLVAGLAGSVAGRCGGSRSDAVRTHHLVVLVLDDVAVPHEQAGAVVGRLHARDLPGVGDDGVLAAGLP